MKHTIKKPILAALAALIVLTLTAFTPASAHEQKSAPELGQTQTETQTRASRANKISSRDNSHTAGSGAETGASGNMENNASHEDNALKIVKGSNGRMKSNITYISENVPPASGGASLALWWLLLIAVLFTASAIAVAVIFARRASKQAKRA